MLQTFRQAPAVVASLLFHVALLAAFAAIKFQLFDERPPVAVQTVFVEPREQEEFTQELTVETEVSESLSVVSGGLQSTTLGSTQAPAVSQKKIEQSENLQTPQQLAVGMVDLPSMNLLGEAVGEGELNGEAGARADGYGAALSRISQELMRLMREQPVLAVWLFDASSSLTNDRDEISDQFDKVYEELNLARTEASRRKQKYEPIETMVAQFGGGVIELMPEPSADLAVIRKAIQAIDEDTSGAENVFQGVGQTLEKYGPGARKSKRKLVVIVVSDESGDDGGRVEDVIEHTRLFRAPVYFLGREAIFGYPYASVRMIDEETELPVWPTISRGPETALPEAMQWTGFGKRHGWHAENVSSGFGPYEQVRLARESGGIFFLLSDVEEELAGRNTQRRYDPLAMKEYEPLLLSRSEYEQSRTRNTFRNTVWNVIQLLNPNTDADLNIPWHYPIEQDEFQREGAKEFSKAVRALGLLKTCIRQLDSDEMRDLRKKEPEQRWRAAYDLVYAQCMAFQVRLFQFTLALDHMAKNWPEEIQNEDTNRYARYWRQDLLPPDEQQLQATGVTADELENARKQALVAYDVVLKEHPGTPWAVRAEAERRQGFGVAFREHFHDPRYSQVKVPSL